MALNLTNYGSKDSAQWFNRTQPIPLDGTSIFNSLEDASTYAAGGIVTATNSSDETVNIQNGAVAYNGQIITVVAGEEDKTSTDLYVICNKKLVPLGGSKGEVQIDVWDLEPEI